MTWPSIFIGTGWFGSATICAPSSSTVCGSAVSSPTSCLRSALEHVRPGERALADEIGLGLADRPGEADIVRRHRAVGLLADDDVALLGAQHVHRLGAVGRDAVCLAGLVERLPDGAAVARRHVDLEAELAGEADAEQPRRHAADLALGARSYAGTPRRRGRCPRPAARSVLRAFGPLQRDHRPLLGGRGQPHLEVRPLGLEIVLHHVEHARARRRSWW